MACTIKYKGTLYTEDEFKQYIDRNVSEFANLLPAELGREANSSKFSQPLNEIFTKNASIVSAVAESIKDRVSPETLQKISKLYGQSLSNPQFLNALSREITDSIFNRKNDELATLATGELLGAFSAMSESEIAGLQGLERNLYNLTTNQRTKYESYPSINNNEIAFSDENGEWRIFDKQDLINKVQSEELSAEEVYGLPSFLASEVIFNDKVNNTVIANVDYSKILSEQEKTELSKKLFAVLGKLGFSTMKMSEYIKAHKLRTGVDPSVNAIADMVNRVVAIASGENMEGLLSEEVAHILTETYNNQDEIRSILPEVENTDTWKDHAETYFKLYEGKGLTGEQLTEKVRREVLGKLIADKMGKTEVLEATSFIAKVGEVVTNFFNSVKSYLKPSIKSNLDALTTRIADSINEEAKIDEMYDVNQLNENPFSEFYNADVESALTSQLSNLVRDSRKLLKKNRRGSLTSKVDTLATMAASNNLNALSSLQAVAQYLDITNSVKRNVVSKVKKYDEAVKNGQTPKSFINSIDGASINILMTENLPHLRVLSATIKDLEANNYFTDEQLKNFNSLKGRVASQIDSMILEINSLKGEVTLKDTLSGEALMETMISEYRVSPEAAQEIRDYLNSTSRDISTLQMFFGNLQNAPNPILALLGRLIGDIHHRTDVATKHYSRKFIDKLAQLGVPQSGFQKFFDRVIQTTGDNKITGYVKGVIDWGRFEQAKVENEIAAYNAANQIHINTYNAKSTALKLTYTPITDKLQIGETPETPRLSELTGTAKAEYNRIIDEWREENLEQPYTKSFRAARKEMFDFIETTGITLPDGTRVTEIPELVPSMMGGWAEKRREIKAPYIKDGVLDYSQMSEVERLELEAIKRDRLESKSLIDSMGEYKTGDELKIALGLQAIEQYYIQQNTNTDGKRIIKQEFIDKLDTFTDPEKAFEWFSQNSGISFNSNFWDRMDSAAVSSGDKFRNAVSSSDMPDSEKAHVLAKITNLEEELKRRTQFLKQFKNSTSPAEVDTAIMNKSAREIYIGMEHDIEVLFNELNTTLKDFTGTTVQDNLTTESTANESFQRDYDEYKRENPNGNIISFGKENSTYKGYLAIATFNESLRKFQQNGTLNHSKAFRNDITKALGISPDASTDEITNALTGYLKNNGSFEIILENYVKTKVVGYYKRFAPAGFTKFYEQLKTGEISDKSGKKYSLAEIATIIREGNPTNIVFENDIVKYLDLNPEVEWMMDESSLEKNMNFIEDTENVSTNYGGYGQPMYDKYKNQEFINEYNVDENLYKTTGETKSQSTSPEKLKELDFLEFLVHSRYENFISQGVAGVANAYSLPGVRKAAVDKSKDFVKNPVQATKEWYKDFIENSVDKKIYGESATGEIDNDPTNIDRLVVPLLNVQALERLEDTTTDLLYSYTVHTYNANLYEQRQDAMTKANQLETLLLSRDFKDKAVKDSNTHKAFQDFKKAYLLGVHETKRIKVGVGSRKVDLTNILRTFDRALGTVNVGLNPAVSITAASSALTFSATEALAGQYMDVKSFKKGIARFHAKSASFIGQTGEIDKTNEVYLYGERFGLFNILNGVENSGENRFVREMFKDGISGMAHIMTEMMTKPFAPSIMYATLDNFRIVERTDENGVEYDEVMSYERFKSAYRGSNTEAEMKDLWKTYEKNSILNNMTVENGMVKYSDRLEKGMWGNLTEEEKETARNSMELDVKNTVSTIISRVDAKMPVYDKSVASRNALARFLLRHREWFTINFQNRFKRGHNNLATGQNEVGHYVTLTKYLGKTFDAFNPRNDSKLKEIFDELTPTEKINLRRVLIDTAISAILVAIGSLVVSPWGDDKDNKDNWKIQFAAYMYYRLSSEQMSSGLAGVPSYKDMLESPFVAVNSLKELMKPSNWSSDTIERGPYEGHSKIFRLAAKNTFARHYYDLTNGLQQKSDFYRLNNEWTLWGMQKTSIKEQEEKEAYEKELRESYMKGSERFMR